MLHFMHQKVLLDKRSLWKGAYNRMTLNYSKQAIKFLSKQDKPTRIRIVGAINKLPQGDVKKLQKQIYK